MENATKANSEKIMFFCCLHLITFTERQSAVFKEYTVIHSE